jgi:hypothetical protein
MPYFSKNILANSFFKTKSSVPEVLKLIHAYICSGLRYMIAIAVDLGCETLSSQIIMTRDLINTIHRCVF